VLNTEWIDMAGRFEGLSDAEWKLFEDIFPEKERKGCGMPAVHPRKIFNALLFMLGTGCRWCDLPQGPQWGLQPIAVSTHGIL
jgi:transposase